MYYDKFLVLAISLFGNFIGQLQEKGINNNIARDGSHHYGLIEDAIIEIIDDLKEQLKNGLPDMNIPPLDPLDISHLPFNFSLPKLVESEWDLKDVTLTGLMNFEVTNLKIDLNTLNIEYEINFKNINAATKYKLNGLLINLLQLYGDGVIGVSLNELILKGKLSLVTECNMIVLSGFELLPSLKSSHFVLTGLMESNDLSRLVSDELITLVPSVINKNSQQINDAISPNVIKYLNKVLAFVQFDVSA